MDDATIEKLFKIDMVVTSEGTVKEKGSVPGLLICKEFIEKHNGTIKIENNSNNGTTVTFTLPVK